MNLVNTSKKLDKKIIIIATAAVLIIAAVITIIWFSGKDGREIAKNLDLGNKYLTEQNYEEAIVAFNKVLEIDPMNVDAYLHLTEAYVAQAKAAEGVDDLEGAVSFYNSAIEVLKKGYDLTQNQSIGDKLTELQAEVERIQKIIDERAEAEAKRAAQEAKRAAQEAEEAKRRAAEDDLINIFFNEIKVLGLSMNDFMAMSADEVVSYGINKYGLVDTSGLGQAWEKEFGDRWIHVSHCIDHPPAFNGLGYTIFLEHSGSSNFWKYDDYSSGECYIYPYFTLDYVELPDDFFSFQGTIDECIEWFEDKGFSLDADTWRFVGLQIEREDCWYRVMISEGLAGGIYLDLYVNKKA